MDIISISVKSVSYHSHVYHRLKTMKTILCLSIWLLGVTAIPLETERGTVEPEYLDQLLAEKRYEEFSDIMELGNPKLAYSDGIKRSRQEAMFNENLEGGDIVLTSLQREQARQGLNFTRYPNNKWPRCVVPYVLSNEFSETEKKAIGKGIKLWNDNIKCPQLVYRNGHADYVMVFPGQGCYARISKTGGEQPLSLDRNGCINNGTIIHEFIHAIGTAHEHNRLDRDNSVEVLWNNIPSNWQDQYKKTTSPDFIILFKYDYYSIMHYPMNAPGTNKPAFKILSPGEDESRIGRGTTFTSTDINKIAELYR